MATCFKLVLTGDPVTAADAACASLRAQGFTIASNGDGQSVAERGSRPTSALLGGWTDPAKRYVDVTIATEVDEHDRPVLTLTPGETGWCGGVLAKMQSDAAYSSVFTHVADHLRESGFLMADAEE